MDKIDMTILGYCTILIVLIPFLLSLTIKVKKRLRLKKIVNGTTALTPKQFFNLRQSYHGQLKAFDFPGAYIIYNISKRKYYIGQSIHVMSRVNSHLSGRGNGDVYADYKYGDRFEIRMVKLKKSGYKNLNDLERELIDMYDSCKSGYNRQRGNVT